MPRFVISEAGQQRLQQEFIDLYDPNYWRYKLWTFDTIIENTDSFIDLDESLSDSDSQKYVQTLKSEIVMTFYHSAEALFALLFCRDSPIPWYALLNYPTGATYDLARSFRDEDIDQDEIREIFYYYAEPGQDGLDESVSFIHDYLRRMAVEYLDNDVYNSFKHGLRVMPGEREIEIASEDGDESVTMGGSTFLSLGKEEYSLGSVSDGDDEDHDYYEFRRKIRGYDWEVYYHLGIINADLIEQIMNGLAVRIALEEITELESKLFNDLSVSDIFDFDSGKQFKFSFSYELGDRAIEIDD